MVSVRTTVLCSFLILVLLNCCESTEESRGRRMERGNRATDQSRTGSESPAPRANYWSLPGLPTLASYATSGVSAIGSYVSPTFFGTGAQSPTAVPTERIHIEPVRRASSTGPPYRGALSSAVEQQLKENNRFYKNEGIIRHIKLSKEELHELFVREKRQEESENQGNSSEDEDATHKNTNHPSSNPQTEHSPKTQSVPLRKQPGNAPYILKDGIAVFQLDPSFSNPPTDDLNQNKPIAAESSASTSSKPISQVLLSTLEKEEEEKVNNHPVIDCPDIPLPKVHIPPKRPPGPDPRSRVRRSSSLNTIIEQQGLKFSKEFHILRPPPSQSSSSVVISIFNLALSSFDSKFVVKKDLRIHYFARKTKIEDQINWYDHIVIDNLCDAGKIAELMGGPNFKKPIVIFVHGFLSDEAIILDYAQEFMSQKDYQMIGISWVRGSSNTMSYETAKKRTVEVI